MEYSEFINTVEDVFAAGLSNRLLFQTVDDDNFDGKHVTLDGKRLISFGSCSYLGLETDPRMIEGAREAAARYGTQFSCSRGFLSATPYGVLEERFSTIFGGHALVSPTTTLGHLATIPILATEKDGIVLDHQVHASVQLAATVARANGAAVELVRHGDVTKLEERIATLCKTRERVWHMIDGVFSMFGDLPDIDLLNDLLARYPQLHLYVDDAHGMSVDGLHGRGIHLARMPMHGRMVLATSFAKAFGAGGAAIVFPDAQTRDRVRMCGAPLTFGGPMQPPMLGALLAGTDIHMSDDIYVYQQALRERIALLNQLLVERGLPLHAENHTPIFFVRTGPPKLAWNIAARMRDRHGFFLNVSVYPTVPMKRSGLRLAVTRHHSPEDLKRLVDALAQEWPLALEEEGVTREEIDANFVDDFETRRDKSFRELFAVEGRVRLGRAQRTLARREGLELQHARSIDAFDEAEWDSLLGDRGCFAASALGMLERTFRDRPEPENNWQFHYFVVRQDGRPVAATFFCDALVKDDMLMRSDVSQRIEEHRQEDPYFLTSRALTMGSHLSEGNHLFLDRTGRWQDALGWILEEAGALLQQERIKAMILRDLPAGDAELDAFLQDVGYVKVPMLTSYDLAVNEWDTDEEYVSRLGRSTRKVFRQEVLENENKFRYRLLGVGHETPTDDELAHLHQLYLNVKGRKVRLNTFELPTTVLGEMCRTKGWEIVELYLPEEFGGPANGRPVGFVAGFRAATRYTGMVCGIDYEFQKKHVYRQILWQMIRRTRAHGCTALALGVDADFEKQRLGCASHGQSVYLFATDDFGGYQLRQVVEEVGLRRTA